MHRFQMFCESNQDDGKSLIAYAVFKDQDNLHQLLGHEFGRHEMAGRYLLRLFFQVCDHEHVCVHHILTQPDARNGRPSLAQAFGSPASCGNSLRQTFWNPQMGPAEISTKEQIPTTRSSNSCCATLRYTT